MKICFFLEIGPYPKIFSVKFFRGEYLRNRYALTIQNMYIYRGLTDIFVRVIPARSREMAAKSDVPAKVRCRNKKLLGQTKHLWAKSSWEDFLNCISKILSGGFRSKMSRLAETFFLTAPLGPDFFLKRGSTSAGCKSALKTLYPPLPYIFWKLWTCSFTQYMSYLLKNSKSRFREPRKQWFWGSEAQIT